MTVKASDVLQRVRTILQDGGSTRWPLDELAQWLSDAQREIANLKPSATATKVVVELVLGTRQTVPAGYSNMIRVVQNVTGAGPAYVGGMAITPVVREILDNQNPNWHDPAKKPFRKKVYHVIMDPLEPLAYYVYPGNDATGKMEAIFSKIPVDIVATGEVLDLDSYDIDLPFIQSYQSVMIDYVLYRAFSKDMQFAGAADRATAHFTQFQNAVGVRTTMDGTYNVNTTNSQPNS